MSQKTVNLVGIFVIHLFSSFLLGQSEIDSRFRFIPKLVGVPETEIVQSVLPGYFERAWAAQILMKELNQSESRAELFRYFPHWPSWLKRHPGYFEELMDLSQQPTMRIYGPDIWKMDGKYYVGEENSNPGGAEFHQYLSKIFSETPNFGAVPFNPNDHRRWIQEIRRNASTYLGLSRRLKIVWADEASVRKEPMFVSDGQSVAPPFPVGEGMIQQMKEVLKSTDTEFISLVDDRDRLVIKDDQLYLLGEGGQPEKVDVLIWAADIESLDPAHQAQLDRNTRAGKSSYNSVAQLIGKPGLISAWIKKSFFLVNDPRSLIARAKIFPIMIDEWIQWKTGKAPLLPTLPSRVFFDQDNQFDELKFQEILRNPDQFVMKAVLGGGGSDVTILRSMSSDQRGQFLIQMEQRLRTNPEYALAQEYRELSTGTFRDAIMKHDLRILSLVSGSHDQFSIIPSLHLLVRASADKMNASSGAWTALAVPSQETEVRELAPIPFVGARQIGFSHYISEDNAQMLYQDGLMTSIMAGHFLRELYFSPETLWRDFPELKPIIEKSFYYKPNHFLALQNSGFPSVFMIAPDDFDEGPSQGGDRYSKLELNPTNIGGIIRMLQARMPGMEAAMRQLFSKVEEMFKQVKHHIENPFSVYLIEDSQLARPGSQKYDPQFISDLENFRSWFREEFNVELVSLKQMKNFKIENRELFYGSGTNLKKVDIFYSNFEPDFLCPERTPADQLLQIMSEEDCRERQQYAIPGIYDVAEAGNLFLINQPGHDIVGIKALLPYYPKLYQRYLEQTETVKTKASFSFLNADGSLNEKALKLIESEPNKWVIKNGEITGGGSGVSILRLLTEREKADLFQQVRSRPQEFSYQSYGKAWNNPYRFRTELRVMSVIGFSKERSPQPLVQFPVIYGRGAPEGQSHANLIPSQPGQLPGFVVPVRVNNDCARSLEDLSQRFPAPSDR